MNWLQSIDPISAGVYSLALVIFACFAFRIGGDLGMWVLLWLCQL